jgi:hypothetical protein
MNNEPDLVNALLSPLSGLLLFSGTQTNCCIRSGEKMWTRQVSSLPRTLKNVYCASGQQSHRGQGNERLNHHKDFGPS